MKSRGYNLIQVIIIIIITAVISGLTTGFIYSRNLTYKSGTDYENLTNDENIKSFLNVYNELNNDYYENINKEEVIKGAINGMLSALGETYTTYLDKNSTDYLLSELNGTTYDGVGITIKDNEIISIITDSPADAIGLRPGDKIIKVNGESVENKKGDELSSLIKKDGKNVTLEVERDNEVNTYKLSIAKLKVPRVNYYMIENSNIGYLRIEVFAKDITKEVEKAINELEKQGMKSLIIDVRSNSGGILEEAASVASLFLTKGKIIYSLEDKNKKITNYKDEDNKSKDYPIVILINKMTASAAEILTTALKDSYSNVNVVGIKSYGKGKVQHTYTLKTGEIVKYTSSKWLRPNGTCIDGSGIKPDYELDNEYIYDNPELENRVIIGIDDKQLKKAEELLK